MAEEAAKVAKEREGLVGGGEEYEARTGRRADGMKGLSSRDQEEITWLMWWGVGGQSKDQEGGQENASSTPVLTAP